MGNGLIGKMFQWGTSASYSDTTVSIWLAGLALVLIASFLWSTVVHDVFAEVKAI